MLIKKIPFDGVSGQIFGGQMPKAMRDVKQREKVAAELHEAAINTIVLLCPSHECQKGTGIDLAKFYQESGFEVIQFPIKNFSVPKTDALVDLIDRIHEQALKGLNIMVHCKGGKGRTGLILACLKRKVEGCDADSAIHMVQQSIPGAVETPAQRELVASFLMA